MGLNLQSIEFLFYLKQKGVLFNKLATLGKQDYYLKSYEKKAIQKKIGFTNVTKSSDGLFQYLGAESLDYIDNSAYEGANILLDLNMPIAEQYKAQYDCLIDGGSLEHVFNFPIAIKNCMEMVAIGGHLVLMTPWHGCAGHGFYQFSPELFYRCLCPENGFELECVIIHENNNWFQIADPALVGDRVEHHGYDEITLFIAARRTHKAQIFKRVPQQSYYQSAWVQKTNELVKMPSKSKIKERMVESFPILERMQDKWRRLKKRKNNQNWKTYLNLPSI